MDLICGVCQPSFAFIPLKEKKKLYILQNILFEYFKNDMKVSK